MLGEGFEASIGPGRAVFEHVEPGTPFESSNGTVAELSVTKEDGVTRAADYRVQPSRPSRSTHLGPFSNNLLCEFDDLSRLHDLFSPAFWYSAVPVVSARDLPVDGARRVRIVAQVHRQ